MTSTLTKRNSDKGLRVLGNRQHLPECHFSLCGVWPVFWLLELQEFLFPLSCLCWPVFQAIMLQNLKFCCNKHQILMESNGNYGEIKHHFYSNSQ